VPIRSLAQLNELLKQVPNGRNVAFLVRRGDGASYVAIKLDEK
jgi:serine protease Do